MTLAARLARRIACGGPLRISEYMTACLHDPAEGYYAVRPRLGAEGDFITAPQVSQMFGELIGLWVVEVWNRLGCPPRLRLAELGPGEGILMADALRAMGQVSGLAGGLVLVEVVLVETSPPLRRRQADALGRSDAPVRWLEHVTDIPVDAPVVILANEFLDCLPIDQAVRRPEGWFERRIGLDGDGRLAFQVGRRAPRQIPQALRSAPCGAVAEWSESLESTGRAVGGLIAGAGGAGLFIDYGKEAPAWGDTLQAVRAHTKEGPLARPGEADLTAHVDFPAFLAAARAGGARTAGLRTQSAFLEALGLEARAHALAGAAPGRETLIERQFRRLMDADQMGELFKAACVHSRGLDPPGFEAS